MRTSLIVGALLLGGAAGTAYGAKGAIDRDAPRAGPRSAVVIRAGAPWAVGEGRGDVALRGACWRIAAGWSSAGRSTRVAIAVARTCS